MPEALDGTVTTRPDGTAPASTDETLYVISPLYDGGRTKWPCRWIGGPVAVGDRCVVIQTDDQPWAVGLGPRVPALASGQGLVWSGSAWVATDLATQSELAVAEAALDVRLDALEGPITVHEFSAAASVDIFVDSTTQNFIELDFEVELSTLADFRLRLNNDSSSIYSYIRDGSVQSSAPASIGVAAAGAVNHNNGYMLAFPPLAAVGGGVSLAGRAIVQLRAASRRTCVVQTALTSVTGSGNHVIELQNIANLYNSTAALTFMRLFPGAGTMTGCIQGRRVG
jgi:hypothetical protein